MIIPRRYNGPDGTANGGYAAGLLAREIAGPAEVTLQKPVPLETELEMRRMGDAAELLVGDTPVASARPAPLPLLTVPAMPEGGARLTLDGHPYPRCFVCGPDRAEGDGLRILPERIQADGLVSAAWTPSADLTAASGTLPVELVWAALDCTGGWAILAPRPRPLLLGRLTAELRQPVEAGVPYAVLGWPISQEGRKYVAGTAIIGSDGSARAVAAATWIAPRPR